MKGKLLIVATLVLLGFYVTTQGIPAPVLPLMGGELNVTNKSTLSLILTLPALFMIPMMLLSGVLAARMSKKTLAYIGGLLFLIGGLGPIFTNNFTLVLVCRAILGLGIGIYFPLPYSMITDYFEGQSRHTMMGIISAGSSVWATLCVVLSGIVGKVTWQNAFYLHVFGIVPLLFVFFFLPKVKEGESITETAVEQQGGAPAFGTYVYALALFLFFATIQMLGNVIAAFVTGEGLGGASTAGSAMGVQAVASFATGICFGPLFGWLKKWSAFAGIAVSAAGYVLLSLSSGVPMMMLSVILVGAGMGLMAPVLMTWSANASPNAVSLAYAIAQVGMMFGIFASSLFLELFAMFGGGAPRMTFLYSGVMLAGLALAFLVGAMKGSAKVTRGEVT